MRLLDAIVFRLLMLVPGQRRRLAELDNEIFDAIFEHAFEETEARYSEHSSTSNPSVPESVRKAALNARANWAHNLDEHSANGVYTLVLRAYLWRRAEHGPRDLVHQQIDVVIDETVRIAEQAPDLLARLRSSDDPFVQRIGLITTDDIHLLTRDQASFVALKCLRTDVPVWFGCPGGVPQGRDFFELSFERLTHDFTDHEFELPAELAWQAFRYGYCLHDVETRMRERGIDPS